MQTNFQNFYLHFNIRLHLQSCCKFVNENIVSQYKYALIINNIRGGVILFEDTKVYYDTSIF